jgi:MOSC domain-containing protein YiiM
MPLEMKELLNNIPQVGIVDWIGLRPGRREPLVVSNSVEALTTGLEGDRFKGKVNAKRMVTLIQQEHLDVVASILQVPSVAPAMLRRNIVVSKINLQALKDQHFQIGEAIFYGTGNCPPCSRMEENLGAGGYNAMRGHGGITATVIQPGKISVGAQVKLLAKHDPE